jgi:5-methylcytosine-specific restriction protein A
MGQSSRESKRKYRFSDKGRAKAICDVARYYSTDKGKETRKRYDSSEKGKATKRRADLKWLQSDKGKAYVCGRYERLGNNNSWRDISNYWIFVEERPCVKCGETDKSLLQCDHITPRAVGGTDDPLNLQILCKKCHKQKTKEDVEKMKT